jgi:integrase
MPRVSLTLRSGSRPPREETNVRTSDRRRQLPRLAGARRNCASCACWDQNDSNQRKWTQPLPNAIDPANVSAWPATREPKAQPYGVLVLTLAYGGMRWGEAVALRRSRCDLLHSKLEIRESLGEVNGQLHFGPTKTYAARTVLLPAFLREAIAQHLEEQVGEESDALVFTAPNGGPLRNSTWHSRFWTPAVWAAGLPDRLRIHDLRHTCAALLISRGAHVKAVQRHLGHSSANVTLNTYSHLFPDAMERVVDGLEETYREAVTACRRPELDARVVDLESAGATHVL